MAHLNPYKGKKLEEDALKFTRDNDFFSKGMPARIRAGLRAGKLTDHHFNYFEKESIQTLSDFEIPISTGIQRIGGPDKQVLARGNYMSVARSADGSADLDFYVPASLYQAIGRNFFKFETNVWPLRVHAKHLAFRFIQRAQLPGSDLDIVKLDVEESPFINSLGFAMNIAQSFGNKLNDEAGGPRAVIVPHERGILRGYIEGAPEDAFALATTIALRRGKSVEIRDYYPSELAQPYKPRAMITIKTFFENARCKPYELELRQKLLDVFAQAASYNGLIDASIISNFRALKVPAEPLPESLKAKLSAYFASLQQIMQSSQWQRMENYAAEHHHVGESLFDQMDKNGLKSHRPSILMTQMKLE